MGNKINVTFLHPTNGQDMEVEIDDSMTATALINELIASNFIPNSSRGGYKLLIKDKQVEIGGSQTAASGGARDGSIIRVIAITDAGAEKINVTFLHPTNGRDMEVEIDSSLTASDVINELITNNFIPDNSNSGGYKLLIKETQTEIGGSQTVESGGAHDGSVIRIVGATDAGANYEED